MSDPIAPPDVWNWMVEHFKPIEIHYKGQIETYNQAIVVDDRDLCKWALKIPLENLDVHCFEAKYKAYQLANAYIYNGAKGFKVLKSRWVYDEIKIIWE